MIRNPSFTAVCTAGLLVTACAVPERADCFDAARFADLPQSLDEASGIAVSRRQPDVIWAHNDSEGSPTLYALDRTGRLLSEIAIAGAGRQFDWEDIAAGPCPAGHCLYIGDIGDNLHDRDDRAILRIAEPDPDASSAAGIERFPIRYPDGPVDAEALFVMPDTSIFIITKGRRQGISVYRYPPPLRAGEQVTLVHVQQLSDGVAQVPDLVTAADASVNGDRVAVRTYRYITLFRFDGDTLVPSYATGFDLIALAEPQGEAVAFAGGDTLLLATEAGPARVQPFLSAVRCGTGDATARMVHPSGDRTSYCETTNCASEGVPPMAAPDKRHHRRQDDPQNAAGDDSPRGRREDDSASAGASTATSGGSTRREMLKRFRQPLIGLGLAGMALPMVQATTSTKPEEPAPDTDAADPEAAAAAAGDVEENLVSRIAETRAETERTQEIEAAVAKYDISRDLAEDIFDIAKEQGIDAKLAYGLVKTESTFDERAVSHVGARGLTQVMPRTAAWLIPGTKTEDLYDRQTNLRLGFRYLDQMIDKYKGDVRLALLAYNRGPGTVDKVLKRGGNPDNGYADKVLRG